MPFVTFVLAALAAAHAVPAGAIASPAADPAKALPSLLGATSSAIMQSFKVCKIATSDPLRVACQVEGLAPAGEAVFLFDAAQKVIAITVPYADPSSLEAGEAAVAPLVRLIESSRGPPQLKKHEAGREWVFSRRHFVALVRVAKKAEGWQVQTVMSDPSYQPVVLARPPAQKP